ncbi:MAG: UDP-N-acetylmuramoyl-L-alanine--D-glutamate ligase [Deltaproteobacteria bacterium]|jgi:UDP-N-acetylmuramoylalanine--D-glutamate ligase|nr:UDP-N-acetylmuramoyl-L-alanine--D-glutamate ligase [Deltaproteobacteria bacterium]
MEFNLENKKVLVVGAGKSGLAAAQLLVAKGADVQITDLKTLEDLNIDEKIFSEKVTCLFGQEYLEYYKNAELIVVSPGVPFNQKGLSAARALNREIIGEMELASRFINRPILAVTGSNGKTTTTSLTGEILTQNLGAAPFVGGNIGNPLANLALLEVKGEPVPAWAVIEVSSFQLETVKDFKALGAAFLNLSPDHLDRHGDLDEYFKVKFRIFNNQNSCDWGIVNEDDPYLAAAKVKGVRFGFSRVKKPEFGGFIQKVGSDEILSVVEGAKVLAEAKWSSFLLTGAHNQENVLAAVGLALAAGVKPEAALLVAQKFAPGDHRLQLVKEIKGVRFFDDSKGTNVGAVARALESFSSPVVLIAGGRDKGLDFSYLRPFVQNRVKDLVLIGESRHKMGAALKGAAPIHLADSLDEAVKVAATLASPGEIVLLSPACASFDQFKDYKDRGDSFARAVHNL